MARIHRIVCISVLLLSGCRSITAPQPVSYSIVQPQPISYAAPPPVCYEMPQYIAYKPPQIMMYEPTETFVQDECPSGFRSVFEHTPSGLTQRMVPEQRTVSTVFQNDRGRPYDDKPLDVATVPAERLAKEQLLITLTNSVRQLTGMLLVRQCIENGSVVIYCTRTDGYDIEIVAVQNDKSPLELTVWVKSKKAAFTVDELNRVGKEVFDNVRREVATLMGIVE